MKMHAAYIPGILFRGLILAGVSGIFLSCEAVFTCSPFSALRRNPENMSREQKLQLAGDALLSSDQDALEEAYTAIYGLLSEETDPGKKNELESLAAGLALSASGVILTDAALLEALLGGGA